jgi:hypothetical protein
MNVDAIISVISSLKCQEIENLGFNARVYIARSELYPELTDMTGGDNTYVGDGIAHVVSMFHFDGKRRARHLVPEDIDAVIDDSTISMLEVTARILDITTDEAMEIFAPSDFDWADITPEMLVDVLHHFLHTGEVVWLPPRPMTGLLSHDELKEMRSRQKIATFAERYGSSTGGLI